MAGRVDLDAVMAEHEEARQAAWSGAVTPAADLAQRVPALVAELRAAREVVEAARVETHTKGQFGWHAPTCVCRLSQALVAYDRVLLDQAAGAGL